MDKQDENPEYGFVISTSKSLLDKLVMTPSTCVSSTMIENSFLMIPLPIGVFFISSGGC
jgi:Na+/serine symporter